MKKNVLDGTGYFVRAVISPLDGGEPLELHATSIKPWIDTVEIITQRGGAGEINIGIQPPTYRECIEFMDSKWLKIGNTISVKWGYANGMISPWHHGFLMKPALSFNEGAMGFTIKATCTGHASSKKQSKLQWNGPITKKEVLDKLAKIYNIEVLWNGRYDINRSGIEEDTQKKLFEIKDFIAQGSMNDWFFAKKIASECGFKLWINRGVIWNFTEISKAQTTTKSLSAIFRYYAQLDVENNVYPLLSFESDSSVLFIPSRGVEATNLGPDGDKEKGGKKEIVDASNTKRQSYSSVAFPWLFPDEDIRSKVKGEKKKPNVLTKGGHRKRIVLPSREKNFPSAVQSAEKIDAEKAGAQATCEVFDLPFLMPGDFVSIEGVGRYFSVTYQVEEITRTFSEGPMASLKLQSSGIGDMYIEKGQKKAKNVKIPKKKKGEVSDFLSDYSSAEEFVEAEEVDINT